MLVQVEREKMSRALRAKKDTTQFVETWFLSELKQQSSILIWFVPPGIRERLISYDVVPVATCRSVNNCGLCAVARDTPFCCLAYLFDWSDWLNSSIVISFSTDRVMFRMKVTSIRFLSDSLIGSDRARAFAFAHRLDMPLKPGLLISDSANRIHQNSFSIMPARAMISYVINTGRLTPWLQHLSYSSSSVGDCFGWDFI